MYMHMYIYIYTLDIHTEHCTIYIYYVYTDVLNKK